MNAVWAVVFGSRAQADRAAARVRAMHTKVNGTLPTPMGPFPAGTRYSALDPELLLWVHATLVDSALLVHSQWVGRLSEADQAAYYEEMKTLRPALRDAAGGDSGDAGRLPRLHGELLASDELCVTDTAHEIARAVLHPPAPLALRPAIEVVNLVTAEPDAAGTAARLRAGLGPRARRGATGSREWVRRIAMPLLPGRLRQVPGGSGYPARAMKIAVSSDMDTPLARRLVEELKSAGHEPVVHSNMYFVRYILSGPGLRPDRADRVGQAGQAVADHHAAHRRRRGS